MKHLKKYLLEIPEREFERTVHNQPDCTVSELLSDTFALLGIPSKYSSEALHELLVDVFLLYACRCLSAKAEGRVFILIPQMKVYEKCGERGRDYATDSAICPSDKR